MLREWWSPYVESVEAAGSAVPGFVQKAVARLLTCGDPEHGFIRLRCPDCAAERALPFSCKGRGLCPSCGARRMHDTAHHLVERVLPDVPIRQYVLSPPSEMVGLLAARGEALSAVSRIFIEAIFAGIRARAGEALHCGAVVFVQRFTKALGTYPHLHVLVLDGGYTELEDGNLEFQEDVPPSSTELRAIEARVEVKFARWLKRHGFLDEEGPSQEELGGWWTSAANEPSGVLAPVGAQRSSRWEVDARVRVVAGDRKGREQLCLYVARPPFAEAQLEVLDEERVRLTFRSPMRSGQRALVLQPLALMRRLAWLVRAIVGIKGPLVELRGLRDGRIGLS